jgi:hypothetical protein
MDEFKLMHFASMCSAILRDDGFSLEPAESIQDFEQRMQVLGKDPSHPMLCSKRHDFTQQNSFAIVVKYQGVDVGGVAAKFEDIGDLTLSQHLARSSSRLYNNGGASPVEAFTHSVDNEIKGRIVYFGELYMHSDYRKGRVDLAALLHHHNALAALKWTPDWIYGFIRQADVLSGKASRYGFTRQYPGCQTWVISGDRRHSTEYLVALAYRDAVDAAGFYLRMPNAFAPWTV